MLKFQRRIVACLILCYVTRLTAGNEGNSSACASKESNIIQWKARIENCLTNLSACLLEEGLNEGISFVNIANELTFRSIFCIYFAHMLVYCISYQ